MIARIFCSLALTALASAHGDHSSSSSKQPPVDENADWMTKHMAEEHQVQSWDAAGFFMLHDYNADDMWQKDELLRTYGLFDESNKDVSAQRREEIGDTLMDLMDQNKDGVVDRNEWLAFIAQGKTLPDMQVGPGHHGDDEYEYEIHHWNKYHDENTKLEDLTHPEDIEHFKKHEQMEDEDERQELLDKQSVVEKNIPQKFLRQ